MLIKLSIDTGKSDIESFTKQVNLKCRTKSLEDGTRTDKNRQIIPQNGSLVGKS